MGTGRIEKGLNYAGTNTVYFGIWTDAQGRRRKKILSTDRRVAQRALAKIVRERDLEVLGLADEEGQVRSLAEVRDQYIEDLETWASSGYFRRIRGILSRLVDEIGDIRIVDIRPDRILVLRQKRIRQGKAHRTCNQETGALKAMLNWAVACGLIGRNPIANLKPLPTGKGYETRPRRALTADEIVALLEASVRVDERLRARWAAEKSSKTRGQYYAARKRRPHIPQGPLWRTLLYTGARWGELTAARWGDLSDRTVTLRAETTKNRRGRALPLIDAVVEDLMALRKVHEELLGREPAADEHIFLGPRGKPVFRSYRRALYRFRELCAEAGIEGVDIHSLRHTFCSELGRAGVGLTQAQKLMGHSDPKLTAALYTHLGVEDLRAAVERLIPAKRRRKQA